MTETGTETDPDATPTVLLDANVLIAWRIIEHEHHERATDYAEALGRLATTPITQGALVRFALREGASRADAATLLAVVTGDARHRFWPDSIPYDARVLRSVIGHRQATDAYLASLARDRGGRVATFDHGLAVTHPDVVVRVPD